MSVSGQLVLGAGGLLSYLLGAIPFCLLLGFWIGETDIRNYGSGNTGATNLARVVSYPVGVLGLALDFLKGFVPAFWMSTWAVSLAGVVQEPALAWTSAAYGMLAIVGHCFPVYLKFDGGKGVATSFGVFVAAMPVVTGMTFLFWLAVAVISGWVSLASILAALSVSVFYALSFAVLNACPACEFEWAGQLLAIAAGLLVVVRHKSNIRRLLKGEEKKFGSEPATGEDVEANK